MPVEERLHTPYRTQGEATTVREVTRSRQSHRRTAAVTWRLLGSLLKRPTCRTLHRLGRGVALRFGGDVWLHAHNVTRVVISGKAHAHRPELVEDVQPALALLPRIKQARHFGLFLGQGCFGFFGPRLFGCALLRFGLLLLGLFVLLAASAATTALALLLFLRGLLLLLRLRLLPCRFLLGPFAHAVGRPAQRVECLACVALQRGVRDRLPVAGHAVVALAVALHQAQVGEALALRIVEWAALLERL